MKNHWPRRRDVHNCIKMVAKAWWRNGLQLRHWFVGSYSVSSLGHGAVGLHLHEYIIFHASSSWTGSLWNRYMNPSIIKLGKRIWTLERWEKHQQPSANAVFTSAYFSARISVPVCRDEIREMSARTSYVNSEKIKTWANDLHIATSSSKIVAYVSSAGSGQVKALYRSPTWSPTQSKFSSPLFNFISPKKSKQKARI